MPDPNTPDPVPPEQGRLAKMPYDLREPTPEKVAARRWNPAGPEDQGRTAPIGTPGW